MTVGKDRLWRKDQAGLGRAMSGRSHRGMRLAALLVAVVATTSLSASAQAATGGATTITAGAAGAGRGLAFSPLRSARATWYGPGFYGRRTACGQVLRPQTIGVAHRRLPCGTAVRFLYRGKRIVARVIDRGPYARGRTWDLTNGARRALRFDGSGAVRYAIALNYRRR